MTANAIIPCWVEADPAREVALDALGLATQADRIADALLPGLSVLTRRARYLSFLLWAATKARETANPGKTVHRYEAELALYEARLHEEGDEHCRGVVGMRSARSYLRQHNNAHPSRPEGLYKNTAFRAYQSLQTRVRPGRD